MAFVAYIIYGLQPADAVKGATTMLNIPSINLSSDVIELNLDGNHLNTPSDTVGSFARNQNTMLLIGHSSSVFKNLNQVQLNAELSYNGESYKVIAKEIIPKERIKMNELLRDSNRKIIKIMTCCGDVYENGDASHRLIITALSS